MQDGDMYDHGCGEKKVCVRFDSPHSRTDTINLLNPLNSCSTVFALPAILKPFSTCSSVVYMRCTTSMKLRNYCRKINVIMQLTYYLYVMLVTSYICRCVWRY